MSTFRVSAFFALALAFSAAAQPIRGRLPLESFTTAQGLANDSITTITTGMVAPTGIAVSVCLIGVRRMLAVIANVADAITIRIFLSGIGIQTTVIAAVADTTVARVSS